MKQPFSKKSDQEIVKNIVREAGQRILEMTELLVLAPKDFSGLAGNIVTQTDIDTDNFLRQELARAFPNIGYYSEETYTETEKELEKELTWVVDPIDGTLNFSRGIPLFAISVALMYQQKPIFSVAYAPRLNEFYWAVKDGGAYLDDKKLHIGKAQNLQNTFGTFYSGDLLTEDRNLVLKYLDDMEVEYGELYSTVIHGVYVASGRHDFMYGVGAALWDIAAIWLIIEEAGGEFKVIKNKKAKPPYNYIDIGGNKAVVQGLTKLVGVTK